MSFRSRLPLLAAALLLVSCTMADMGPLAEPGLDLEVPPAWTAPGPAEAAGEPDSGSPDRWWTSFGDRQLEQIVGEALEHNYDLQAVATAIDAAAAQARIAGAARKPQVGAGLTAARRQQIFVGLPIPGQAGPLKSTSTTYGTSLNVSWEADLWGRLKAGQRAAVDDLGAAEADYDAARLSLAGQVAKAWFSLIEAERQVELAGDTVASRRQTAERVTARYRRGVATPLDVRLARSNQAQAEATLELRRRQLDAGRRQLEILLGRFPAARLEGAAAELPAVPPEIPAGMPATLVTRRPDLAAAERRLAAAGWRVSEARRAFYPSLTLTGSAGTTSDALGDLLDGDFSVWSLAGSLLQPIFQGGRLRALAELAEAGRERALAQYAQGVLRAFAEVETALAAEGLLAAEEAAQATATDESRAAAKLAEDRYLAGVGDYLSILESQRQSFLSESRLYTVRALRLQNRVDLHLALGGGFGG